MAAKKPFEYKHLSQEEQTAVQESVTATTETSVIDDATKHAWELDHASHAALLALTEDEEQKEVHRTAMKTIEDALVAHA